MSPQPPDFAVRGLIEEIARGDSPFRQALATITGTSWLDDAARQSLRAADAKFFGTSPMPPTPQGNPGLPK